MWSSLPESIQKRILEGPGQTRLEIVRTGTWLDDVPWEWLSTGAETPVAALDRVRVVRLIPTVRAAPPLTVAQPIRVLVVAADPGGGDPAQPEVEIRAVGRALEKPAYDLRVIEKARLDALQEALSWSPHILHYIGHGGLSGSTGHLLLHDSQQGARWTPAMEFARLLPASVRLLCLSTCVTAENHEIGGLTRIAFCPQEFPLPTTIVNQYAVTKESASVFWGEFYRRLAELEGAALDALHDARQLVRQASPDTACWASFTLVLRDGADQPLRFGEQGSEQNERFAAELEAQWAVRHANYLAMRMRNLQAGVQRHWQEIDE
jgi:hypothetical protein